MNGKKTTLPDQNILAGNQRSGPVKVSVVGGGQAGSSIWRRERIEMTDPDLDDVAFLSGMFHAPNCNSVCELKDTSNRLPVETRMALIIDWIEFRKQ